MQLSFIIENEGDLLIKSGQKVNFKDPLSKKKSSEEITIHLSSILNAQPKAIFKALKKFVGDEIKKGELVAEHKGLISSKKYYSDVDGIIKEINHNDGTIIIDVDSNKKSCALTFFKGDIINIKDQEITLEVKNYKEYDLKKATCDFGGEIIYLNEQDINNVTEDTVKDKIIIIEKVPEFMQTKLEALGVKGFVFLMPYEEEISLPAALVDEIKDADKLKSNNYPYCIVSRNRNKIYIYT